MRLWNKDDKVEPMHWCPSCGTALVFDEHDRMLAERMLPAREGRYAAVCPKCRKWMPVRYEWRPEFDIGREA